MLEGKEFMAEEDLDTTENITATPSELLTLDPFRVTSRTAANGGHSAYLARELELGTAALKTLE